MGSVIQIWNPRSRTGLRRHWVAFDEQIVISGEDGGQSGVLQLQPAANGCLAACLRVRDREYAQSIAPGHDIVLWINGLRLHIGVQAVEDSRMLVAFGVPSGTRASVTLEAERSDSATTRETPNRAAPATASRIDARVGLCQTRH